MAEEQEGKRNQTCVHRVVDNSNDIQNRFERSNIYREQAEICFATPLADWLRTSQSPSNIVQLEKTERKEKSLFRK